MWDLTVPGNNDHDFYVLAAQSGEGSHVSAGIAPVLVHNANGCGVTPRDGGNFDENGNFISGSSGAQKLADQLRLESANSPFEGNGTLTRQAIDESHRIIPGEDIGNTQLQEQFAQRGGAEQWGKYTTPTYESPYGPFQVHYYYNRTTGDVLYDSDYKVVMNRR